MFRFSTPYFEVEPHTGEFSIKMVLDGEERYVFKRRTVSLRPGQVLLVNAGEEYASVIGTPTESFSVFFCRSDLEDAAHSLVASDGDLLDSPDFPGTLPQVAHVALRSTPEVRTILGAATAALDRDDRIAAAESVRRLLLAALADNLRAAPPRCLTRTRHATRDELISRVLRARALIDDSVGVELDLDTLANEACLSRFHFLRVFSELVGETPVAYARRRRLEYGQQLIRRGKCLETVARLCGYENTRNFRRAYANTFGTVLREGGAD